MSLPAGIRADVSQRMASLDQISPEIIRKIAGVIGQKLKALGEFSRESYGGVRAVAEMLNRLDSAASREILEKIEQQDYDVLRARPSISKVERVGLLLGALTRRAFSRAA